MALSSVSALLLPDAGRVRLFPGLWIGFEPPIELAVFGPLWGWGWFDWGHHDITVDPGRYVLASGGRAAFSGNVWVHNAAHRGASPTLTPV
jgi:hypothetical protein